MFSLAAFFAFLFVLLTAAKHFLFSILAVIVFGYLALLEYKHHQTSRQTLSGYLAAGILCGSLFGIYTHQKYDREVFIEPVYEAFGKITAIKSNSIIVEIKNSRNRLSRIKLRWDPDTSGTEPFLFDRVVFSCRKWRTTSLEGVYAELEKLQAVYNVCSDARFVEFRETHGKFNQLRRDIRNHVRNSLAALGSRTFAPGFVLNETGNLDKVELNLFRKMGIAHLFSASGLHMGLLYSTCFLPLSFLGLRKTGYTLGLCACFVYLCCLDFSIALLRSFIFLLLYLGLKVFKRQTGGKYILYFTIILLELIFPLSCFTPSFILSFLITLMILLYYPQFKKVILVKNRYLKDHLALTISATLGSCFLSVLLFDYYHPLSLVYNLLLVPPSGIYLASIFLYLAFPVFRYFIVSGDYIYRQACWLHYRLVEKYTPENHALFLNVWVLVFFCLTLYFIFLAFQKRYWYLRKFYMKAYALLSVVFFSNFILLKSPEFSHMAFPFGVVQYINGNYYFSGDIAKFYSANFPYLLEKMTYPIGQIYATENFKGPLYENKIHRNVQILGISTEHRDGILRLNDRCYLFISGKMPPERLLKNRRKRQSLTHCGQIHLVYSKNYQPDKAMVKKLFSAFGLSQNVHYMKYFTWYESNAGEKEKTFFPGASGNTTGRSND